MLRPTRAGWYFTAICFGVGFAALNTGNNLLYLVLSLMLAFLVLSGVLSESALRGIQVRRRIASELYAEADNPIAIEIHNAQRRVPAFAIVVEDRMRDDAGETRAAGRTFALRVGAGETETRRYQLRPERRGALDFVGFSVSTRFPFGLFLKSLRIESPAQTLVYPAIEPLRVPPDWHYALEHAGLRFERRSLIAKPENLSVEVAGRDLLIGFKLSNGQFATSVLAELCSDALVVARQT